MSAKAGKRPLRSLTAHEKLDAIRRVHDGESKASVARDIGVPESTLRGWCKNEDKISYLSRQSSPDTDESLEHKEKRIKLEDPLMQPFNLSLKSAVTNYSPNSETRFQDYVKTELDLSKSANLSAKAETPKAPHMSERERNRAELARLSVELGLNRPEMFLPSMNNKQTNISDLSANIGLLAQWNNLLMQQQKILTTPKKVTAAADTSSNITTPPVHTGLLTTVDVEKSSFPKPPSDKQQSVQESVWYWLKTQQAMLGLNQNQTNLNGVSSTASTPVTSMATSTSPVNGTLDQSSWFWKWYKLAYGQVPTATTPDKPILYQQLTKDKDPHNAENLSLNDEKDAMSPPKPPTGNSTKVRSVLDNLLFNNNNNVAVIKKEKEDEEILDQNEAFEHGEKFLKWLETCSDPSVTAMQIMQFKTLLNNVKTGANRRKGDLQNKAKVKRK